MDNQAEERVERAGGNRGGVLSINKQEELALRDWFAQLGAAATVQVKIFREHPKVWRGKNVGGHLGTFTEVLDEGDLRDRWGGGKFRIQAFRLNEKGNWVHYAQRTIEVAGDPKLSGELFEDAAGGAAPESSRSSGSSSEGSEPSIVKQALGMTSELARDERARSRELERELREKASSNTQLLSAMVEPFKMQNQSLEKRLESLERILSDKDSRILELTTRNSPTDKILEKMIDGESARIEAIRTRHESELRQLREGQEGEKQRLQAHYFRETESKERSQQREIDNLRDAHKMQMDGLKLGYEARIDGLQAQLGQLNRELEVTKKEVVELRSKKDVPIEEQITKMVQLKELFAAALGGGEEETPVWAQVLDKVTPAVVSLGEGIANAAQARAQAQAQQVALVPANGNGQVVSAAVPQMQRLKPLSPKPVAPPSPLTGIDPAELKQAVLFAEGAARNETDPQQFASAARSLIPGTVLQFIKQHGTDALLDAVKVDDGTPLSTQAGRSWLRRAGKALTEGAE